MKRAPRAYWACQAGGWSLYVATTIYQGSQHPEMGAVRAVVEPFLSASMGIALTHLMRALARRREWAALEAPMLAPRVALASFALALIHVAGLSVIEDGFYGDVHPSPLLTSLFAVFRWTLIFLVWLALYFGYAIMEQRQRNEVRSLRLERALKDAELGALRSQLNPHFLFNSLNGIRALVAYDPVRAQTAITEISRILRYTLGRGAEATVALEAELSIVDDYLALEALRLEERLKVERTIAPEASSFRIPGMLLQTLVENAIKHGLSELPEGGLLRLSAGVKDGVLLLVVENPRPTSPVSRLEGDESGVGLVNARERLRLIFGTSAGLDVDLSVPGHAIARVTIPAVASP